MRELFHRLWLLSCLRLGPQDMPHSPRLARGLVLCGVGLGLLSLRLLEMEDGPLLQALSLVMLLGLPWVLLSLRDRRERYVQTLIAFAGSGVIVGLVYLPLVIYSTTLPAFEPGQPITREQMVLAWLMLGLIAWQLAISGHIWRHALDWPRAAAILLAAALFILEYGLGRWLGVSAGD